MPETLTSSRAQERRYRILARIGQGACGRVYRAIFIHGPVEKEVALKVINPMADQQQELVHRLMDEARYLGLLSHEAIVKVDSVVQLRGSWAVVMEYVDGADLRHLMRSQRLPLRVTLEIAGEIAGALSYAWRRKDPSGNAIRLVHRDIKPSNVQITGGGKVKLLDFGIARGETARAAETQTMQPLTPGYASPERLRQWMDPESPRLTREDGPPGDIFSLGMMLVEMLLGRHPGQAVLGEQSYATWLKRIVLQVEALEGRPADLPTLIQGMLALRPGDRPDAAQVESRCQEMVDDLRGERLRAWLPRILPSLLEDSQSPASDSWVGEVLTETDAIDTTLNAPERPQGVESAPTLPGWPAVVGGALLLMALAVALALARRHDEAPPGPARTSPPAEVQAPQPADPRPAAQPDKPAVAQEETPAQAGRQPAAPAEATQHPATPTSPRKNTETPARSGSSQAQQPTQSSEEAAAVTSPAPTTGPEAPRLYDASFSGADRVSLSADGKTHALPASLPAGTYAVRASFPGRSGELEVGRLTLSGDVTLSCSAATATCSPGR